MNTDDYEGHTPGPWTVNEEVGVAIKHGEGAHDYVDMENKANAQLMADAPNLLAEVKRLQAYKEFADAVDEWSHGASHIHFLAEQVNHIRSTSQYDDDAMNHGCTSYYNGPNSASQVSDKEYKDLLAEVKRLRENESELLSAISQYKELIE